MDTNLDAHRRLIAMLRKMTPEQRLRRTFEMMEAARELKRIAEAYDRSEDRRDV
jgi:hypothetical protein